jgi:hypothetical protein
VSEELDPTWLLEQLQQARQEPEPSRRAERLVVLGQACIESMDLELRELGRGALEEAAREGSPAGAWLCAYAAMEGIGGLADMDQGLSLLAQAAQGGIPDAAFELGQLLARSGHVPDALPGLGMAADAGHAAALRMLGRMAAGRGERDTAEQLLTAAAEAGSNQAVFDRFLLLAQFGPTAQLVEELDALLARRDVPAGLIAGVARATAVPARRGSRGGGSAPRRSATTTTPTTRCLCCSPRRWRAGLRSDSARRDGSSDSGERSSRCRRCAPRPKATACTRGCSSEPATARGCGGSRATSRGRRSRWTGSRRSLGTGCASR